MDSTWIEKHEVSKAESLGYMVVEPEAVIATHLNQLLNKYFYFLKLYILPTLGHHY